MARARGRFGPNGVSLSRFRQCAIISLCPRHSVQAVVACPHRVFRYKDLRAWWTNPHHDRPGGVESASPTAWLPQSKPIRFTEAGCPAIDKGSNQPNLFFDPKSSESAFPHFSTGARDDLIQRRYLEALHLWWNDATNNPTSGLYPGRMVDTAEIALWTWDARPFPAFPGRADVWGDAANWQLGHWLTGRLGAASLSDLIRELCLRSGLPAGYLDTSRLSDTVPGFAVAGLESPRAWIEPLARYFGFDMVESQGVLRFVPRGRAAVAEITADELVVSEAGQSEDITFTRAQETELPRVLKWRLLSPDEAYDALTVEARRITVDTARIRAEQFPIAHPAELADRNARRALLEDWVGREEAAFALPPSRLALDPTDVVRIAHDGRAQDFALLRIADGEARRIEARRTDAAIYGLPSGPARPPVAVAPTVYGPPEVAFLDLPQLSEDAPAHRPYAAAFAAPWYGSAVVWRSATLDGFEAFDLLDQPGRFGSLAAALPPGPVWRFDKANALLIDVVGSGAFASVTDDQLLAGANALAVESAPGIWEVLQFGAAELIGTGRWQLTRLLRGQLGTEDAIGAPTPIGARVVVLDAAVKPLAIGEAEIGLPWTWRVGPAGRSAGDPLNVGLAFTPAGRGLRPWSPVQLKRVAQPGGDLLLSWIRRTRALSGDSWVLSEAALGEAAESYDLEILNGETVVRTVSGLSIPAFTYTVAMMVADFGAPVTSVHFRVFQIGALGRGAAGELPA